MNIIPAHKINFNNLPENLEVAWDTENNGLIDEKSIDYTKTPYKLRDSFKTHCWVAIDLNSEDVYTFVQDEIQQYFTEFAKHVSKWIAHNGINYDHLVAKLAIGLDYTVEEDSVGGRKCIIEDTLVMSKTLNPDRPSHSLEYAGQVLGFPKIDWRQKAIDLGLIGPHAPKGAEFENYHPEMLHYCIRDCQVGKAWYKYLLKEWGDWDWAEAYKLEKQVAEIITRQAHRGFYFDRELAKSNVKELDQLMEEIRAKVEPTLPTKPATKALQKEFTPPKNQFKKDGSLSANMIKFAKKINGILSEATEGFVLDFNGTTCGLPLPQEPLVTEAPMTLADSTYIKEYLVRDFNWVPSSFKERDLTVDQKKRKISKQKFQQVVEGYVDQTLSSAFCKYRCEHLKVRPEQIKEKLLSHDMKKPLKVLTNPDFTVGQEKELCPGLAKIADKYPHAQAIAHWLTYRHRRNSILGGGAELDEEAEKGFLSSVREDGRIPTPADTCGCNTGRMKHRIVANIPRVTSLYGGNMRAMFGVDLANQYQLGYDADGLEARIEAHYTWKYPGGKEYAKLLVTPKPNDLHTSNATKFNIPRDDSKTLKYSCSYGAQPPKIAKQMGWPLSKAKRIFNSFWEEAKPLELLKKNLEKYWGNIGDKSFILGIDGRKVPTRSKHALLNSLFQSAGLICMKKAMVLHDKELKEKDLIIDLFKEKTRDINYTQQLIAYHDEAQNELTRDLVKFKMFDTKEEAQAFDEPHWSDVGSAPDGRYYRAYSIVGELAQKAVTEAGKYYNLNIDLTAGYAVGRNWKECH